MPDGRPAVRMSADLGEELVRWIDEGREGEALRVLQRARAAASRPKAGSR